ncbi:MAG: repeat-containing protein [Planctomycetaceae bacterium]|nr:repeat-containing protein [Planctomycetaceae bacterium]
MTKATFQLFVIGFFCWLSAASITAADRYGGVEIGAKGVKATAIEVDTSGDTPTLKVLELDKKTVDVTISRLKGKKFDSALVEDTALVVKDFIAALKSELNVPEENIQVVASSGVPFADNIADLGKAIEEQAMKELARIDAIEEATLTAIALVPKELRTKILVVDVGSGNTKGGTFLDESGTPDQFATLEVPFGTQTLSKAIDVKLAESAGKTRDLVAAEMALESVGTPITKQLEEKADLAERKQVLFTGGSVWACMTILKPETALQPFPKLTAADIKAYVTLINANPGKYPEIDFTKIADEAARAAAQKDYDRIRGTAGDKPPVFQPDELQAGAALLHQLSETLGFESKQVHFDRQAVTAWITAKITPEDLRALIPTALGRKLELSEEVAQVAPETPAATKVQRFGGVEIGAKGVKAVAVEVDSTGEMPVLKLLELDKKTVDLTISRLKGKKFDSALVEDTSLVVKDFIEALKTELKVPEESIEVVASSGVPFADNIAELSTAIETQTMKKLNRIDAIEEATLTAVALVPKDLRTQVLVVDVGSGNTKGGTFLDESGTPEQFATLEVPFGTQTLSKAIDVKLAETAGAERTAVAADVALELVGKPLQQQLADKPVINDRKQVLFAGGSVWACVTIMKPETALQPFPKLTAADIKAYVALINANPGKYPEIDFMKIEDEAARAAAQKDYDRIRGTTGDKPAVFRPEELQAGAALLEQVSESLDFKTRQVHFDRQAVTAWISARITPAELRDLLPAAIGRAVPPLLPIETAEAAPPETTTEVKPATPPAPAPVPTATPAPVPQMPAKAPEKVRVQIAKPTEPPIPAPERVTTKPSRPLLKWEIERLNSPPFKSRYTQTPKTTAEMELFRKP